MPRFPIFMTGALGSTGESLAYELATQQDYPVIAVTRSREKFTAFQDKVRKAGGIVPRGLIADVTNADQFSDAFEKLKIEKGMPMHLLAFHAEGIKSASMRLARGIMPMRREARTGLVSRETAEQVAAFTKEFGQDAIVRNEAMAVNYRGVQNITSTLHNHGHLHPDSRTATLSSTPSDAYNPKLPEQYPGPEFYRPIAQSKKAGVLFLKRVAESLGTRYIDFVAPAIDGTSMDNMIEEFVEMIRKVDVQSTPRIELPRVTIPDVVAATVNELHRESVPHIRKVYIDEGGRTTATRPASWEKARIPYL